LRSASARRALALAGLLALGACTAPPTDRETQADRRALGEDPVLRQALFDPLMIDPDLSSTNEAAAAIRLEFDHPLPPIETSAETLSIARDEARSRLLALEARAVAPAPWRASRPGDRAFEALAQGAGKPQLAERAAPFLRLDPRCMAKLEFGPIWASRLSEATPIYPRGAVHEAAGVDSPKCRVRLASYWSAAEPQEITDYHRAFLVEARLDPRAARLGDLWMVFASKGTTRAGVVVSRMSRDLARVDIYNLW